MCVKIIVIQEVNLNVLGIRVEGKCDYDLINSLQERWGEKY